MPIDLGQFKKKPIEKKVEKPVSKLKYDTEKKPKKRKESISFVESLPSLDIDDISFYYRQFTGERRSHIRGARTTKNYMINKIIKCLEQSKTDKKGDEEIKWK